MTWRRIPHKKRTKDVVPQKPNKLKITVSKSREKYIPQRIENIIINKQI